MSFTPEKNETIILAKGELPAKDRDSIMHLLSRLGLETTFLDEETFKHYIGYHASLGQSAPNNDNKLGPTYDGKSEIQPLESIHSRGDYLVREHFATFRQAYVPHMDKSSPSRAFNWCVNHDTTRSSYGRNSNGYHALLNPVTHPMLTVQTRSELGLPAYTGPLVDPVARTTTSYAIENGSFIDLSHSLQDNPKPRIAATFIIGMANLLEAQLKS